MRKLVCLLLFVIFSAVLFSQSVGIGTSSPNSSSILHLNSTTKGLLIPVMTTTQRNAIVSPADGLLIYNTTTNELNQRQNGGWKIIINNDAWTGGGSGQLFNIGDNVGINTAGPSERLDVSGNIRSNSSMIIDNTTAILQLKSGGVNKGFVQLSGNNLRLGTNSGNANGKIVFRSNGEDFIVIDSVGNMYMNSLNPDHANLQINQKLTRRHAPEENFLPIAHGTISADGSSSIWVSPIGNTTVSKVGTGRYTINFGNARLTPRSSIVVTPQSNTPLICTARYNLNGPDVEIFVFTLAGVPVDAAFFFMINDPANIFN